jgi:hypothetical protein
MGITQSCQKGCNEFREERDKSFFLSTIARISSDICTLTDDSYIPDVISYGVPGLPRKHYINKKELNDGGFVINNRSIFQKNTDIDILKSLTYIDIA